MELQENTYTCDGKVYSALKLVDQSKKYAKFEMPLAGISLRLDAWGIEDLDDFIYHVQRLKNTDLKYPIILDKYGSVADGYHRICKAILLGRKTISAIRLEEMPDPDRIEKENGNK